MTDNERSYDVVLLGEPLIEISTTSSFAHGVPGELGVSGDVVNAGAAAAAAGARVALVARVADDELGDAVCARVRDLGIDDTHIRRVTGQQGAYFLHIDPLGQRQFSYARTGSVGSQLAVEDVPMGVVRSAGVVLGSGITVALSASARRAVMVAAENAPRFVYDPNYRPRLTNVAQARAALRDLAPFCSVILPSAPGEIGDLLEVTDPSTAGAMLRSWGADAVAVTRGADGVTVVSPDAVYDVDPVPAPSVVDQTGAGDVFAGTVSARLALGDDLATAVRVAGAAASLSVGGRGGTGSIASLVDVRAHLAQATV